MPGASLWDNQKFAGNRGEVEEWKSGKERQASSI
jgi:hypothetical protein